MKNTQQGCQDPLHFLSEHTGDVAWGIFVVDERHREGLLALAAAKDRARSVAEIQQMVGLNTAHVYGFDVEALAPLAARIGPTKEEIAEPLAASEIPPAALKCPAFAPYNQAPV